MVLLTKGKKCKCGSKMVFVGQDIYSCSRENCDISYNSKTDSYVDRQEAMDHILKMKEELLNIINEAVEIQNKYFSKREF